MADDTNGKLVRSSASLIGVPAKKYNFRTASKLSDRRGVKLKENVFIPSRSFKPTRRGGRQSAGQ
jgi:hypothetical protein